MKGYESEIPRVNIVVIFRRRKTRGIPKVHFGSRCGIRQVCREENIKKCECEEEREKFSLFPNAFKSEREENIGGNTK